MATMAARKRILAYIADDSERKASFKKRKKGLLKKVRELTVLCDVEACAIIGSPFVDLEPEVWPSVEGMQRTVARFKSLPGPEQTRKKYSQEKITKERMEKVQAKLLKVARENREKEMTEVMFQCLRGDHPQTISPMNIIDLNDLAWVTNKHLKEITEKFEALMKEGSSLAGKNDEISGLVAPAMAGMQNYQGNGDMITPMLLPNGSWLPNVNTNSTQK